MSKNAAGKLTIVTPVQAKAAYDFSASDDVVSLYQIPNGGTTLQLPDDPSSGEAYECADADGTCSGTNPIIIAAAAGQSIEGGSSLSLTQAFSNAKVVFDETHRTWSVTSRAGAGGGGPDTDAVVFTADPTQSSIRSNRQVNQAAADAGSIGLTALGSDSTGVLAATSGNYATVSGGDQNLTSAPFTSIAGGLLGTASANNAHVAGGLLNAASNVAAHAEGLQTTASGQASHSEGSNTTANADSSHAEGSGTTASGVAAHAEGENGTQATGTGAHAEGHGSLASNIGAHSEGITSTASGPGAHSEGTSTLASGSAAHAQGEFSVASGRDSNAQGAGSFTTDLGQEALACGPATTQATAEAARQTSRYVLRGTTPGAVQNEQAILLLGHTLADTPISVVDKKAYVLRATGIVRSETGGVATIFGFDLCAAMRVESGVQVYFTISSNGAGDVGLGGTTFGFVSQNAGAAIAVEVTLGGDVPWATDIVCKVEATETIQGTI